MTTACLFFCPEIPKGGLKQSMHKPFTNLTIEDICKSPSLEGDPTVALISRAHITYILSSKGSRGYAVLCRDAGGSEESELKELDSPVLEPSEGPQLGGNSASESTETPGNQSSEGGRSLRARRPINYALSSTTSNRIGDEEPSDTVPQRTIHAIRAEAKIRRRLRNRAQNAVSHQDLSQSTFEINRAQSDEIRRQIAEEDLSIYESIHITVEDEALRLALPQNRK
ncbi:hypothetical protein ACMFMG_006804 [Clarireedia jacksonii]